MITLFFVLGIALLITGVWGAKNIDDDTPLTFTCMVLGMFGMFVWIAISFCSSQGQPNVFVTQEYTLEKTPYRIIISTEQVKSKNFTDAFWVKKVEECKIKGVKVTVPHNAWGIELTSQISIEPVFEEK